MQYILLDSSASGSGRNGRPTHHTPSSGAPRIPILITCINETSSEFHTCPSAATCPSPSAASSSKQRPAPSTTTCPEYFRYIHSDLSPWRDAGITRETVERARDKATFRLVVVAGRAYVEKYRPAFQTRDVFTLWGILQLLARYPGCVPDLDLMFFCDDTPVVHAAAYPDPSMAPPLFMYCKNDSALGIVFPDRDILGLAGSEHPAVGTVPGGGGARDPASALGNPDVGGLRSDLMRCNASDNGKDWNARLVRQDWEDADWNGFKDSNLAKQCTYRYKIYVQGRTWSVSQKYILACGSPMLRIDTPFHNFFSRGLVAGKHYWPIDAARMCPSIKSAVDWGNAHPVQAQRMGEEGSSFARDELSMDYVYDYMLHQLTQYAWLLRYRPTVPENATELCLESMACPVDGCAGEFMMESMEKYAADYEPCSLPPPFTLYYKVGQRVEEVGSKVKRMEEREWKET
ncbi:O-glucosyltransferase rumi-like [Panicum miliaceum]|uniref:O-glucosyltransferase rumi-like n=1 Tax=Panicum miliaceum TaxID=4540 RepID=A0A3L6RC88_PANMI|nr:O-glucosyltransferase rumi-like [Panicum miliaceum]